MLGNKSCARKERYHEQLWCEKRSVGHLGYLTTRDSDTVCKAQFRASSVTSELTCNLLLCVSTRLCAHLSRDEGPFFGGPRMCFRYSPCWAEIWDDPLGWAEICLIRARETKRERRRQVHLRQLMRAFGAASRKPRFLFALLKPSGRCSGRFRARFWPKTAPCDWLPP